MHVCINAGQEFQKGEGRLTNRYYGSVHAVGQPACLQRISPNLLHTSSSQNIPVPKPAPMKDCRLISVRDITQQYLMSYHTS